MVVLGIDPGFTTTGFGVLKKVGGTVMLLDYGCLSLPRDESLAVRIALFYDFFVQKIELWQVTHISLETPFLGKNPQAFLKLGYLRGILYLLVARYSLSLHEFTPREIKLSVTGFGAAQKDQVARVMMRLFPVISMPTKLDTTDALAISLCGIWKASLRV